MEAMRKVTGNYVIQIVGKALSILFGLVTVGMLTRTLGDTGFGEYTTALTFLSLFGVCVDFGLTLTLVQMIAQRGQDEARIVGNVLGLRLVSGAVFYALAPLAVLAFPYTADVKQGVAIGALAYLLMSTAGMLVGVFQTHLQMWRFAFAELVNRACYLLLVGVLAYLGFGLTAMVAAMVAANLLWLLVTVYLAKPLVRIQPLFETRVWAEAIQRSWPIALSILFNLVYLRGDVILLANFRPFAEVGQYGVAYKVVDVLTAIPVMFMGLLLPTLTSAWCQQAKADFQNAMQKAFDLFAIIILPLAMGALIVAEDLTVLIAGKGYEPAGGALRVLMLAVVFVFLNTLYGHAVVALEKQRVMVCGYALTAVLSLVLYLFAIPRFGMWGAAWVTVFSEAFIACLTVLFVARVAKIRPRIGTAVKAFFASLVMVIALREIPYVHVLIQVVAGGLVYIAVLLGVGGVTWSQLTSMVRSTKAHA
jgi:O-antigen/teichoic acid export membrane protein